MTDGRFAGKVALVTGASKGIGLATATQLAREGASVLLNARGADELQAAAASLDGLPVAARAGSLLDDGVPGALVAEAAERFGGIDLIVNVVGINTFNGSLLEIPERKFAKALAGNAWPTIALVQAALQHGLGEGGAVVAISSIGARQVQPVLGHYSAGKAALEVVIRHLARDLGPRGVRVNAVAPGLVETDMSRILWEGPRADEERSLLPLQRLGKPEDIARVACFLLSADSGWVTGVTLDVDGGRMLAGGEPRELYGVYGTERVGG
jgi:NAD(P)-dependent dehydrogenase (short-subunit alcohol dehydrogenase family)